MSLSLKSQAKLIQTKIETIKGKIFQIQHLTEMVLTEYIVGDAAIEFTEEDKQKIIAEYQTVKAELAALIAELP